MPRGYEPAIDSSHTRSEGVRRRLPAPRREQAASVQLASEVGQFFQDLRRVYGWSPEEAAKRLATRADIIAALEAGDVRRLPPWPETCRIVRTYVSFAQLDPRPALNLIETLQSQVAIDDAAKPGLPQRLMSQGANAAAAFKRGRTQVAGRITKVWHAARQDPRRARRLLIAATVPIALILILTQTSLINAGVSQLPSSVARTIRSVQDYVALQMAPVRNGLRHIEVDDPRSRRADKLPVAAGSD